MVNITIGLLWLKKGQTVQIAHAGVFIGKDDWEKILLVLNQDHNVSVSPDAEPPKESPHEPF